MNEVKQQQYINSSSSSKQYLLHQADSQVLTIKFLYSRFSPMDTTTKMAAPRGQTNQFVLSIGALFSTFALCILISDHILSQNTNMSLFEKDQYHHSPQFLIPIILVNIPIGFLLNSIVTRMLRLFEKVTIFSGLRKYLTLPILHLLSIKIDNCGNTKWFCMYCFLFMILVCKVNLVWGKDDSGFIYGVFVCFGKLVLTNGYVGNLIEAGCASQLMIFSTISKFSEDNVKPQEVRVILPHED